MAVYFWPTDSALSKSDEAQVGLLLFGLYHLALDFFFIFSLIHLEKRLRRKKKQGALAPGVLRILWNFEIVVSVP